MAVEIPNYRIIEKLGVGAQSRVFRARCMRDGSDYTVKIVKIIKPEDAGFVDLLKAEHAIGSVLNHPVIRKIYELRYIRRRLRVQGAILFMEYVSGGPLGYPDRRRVDEILRIFLDVAHGLHAMHQAGFVHADMKPNNILVNADGTVKLIDLGQSARLNESKGKVQGTIDYMAPEQASRGKLDARTDVFGFGATLHRVLTGKPVQTEMNQTVNLGAQNMTVKRLEYSRENVLDQLPTSVSKFIEDCCRADPAQRIADMSAVASRLDLVRTLLGRSSGANGGATSIAPASRETDEKPAAAKSDSKSASRAAITPDDPVSAGLGLLEGSELFDTEDSELDIDEGS
ncbi:MAG: serine/threonine protein kinase [Planctomycetes bacterium]|nr:serine/threonine protein kinase [Planctomycetota bacterium]MBI3836240.1 serine/threonine protein kinase [Planctomycetota bacterium]